MRTVAVRFPAAVLATGFFVCCHSYDVRAAEHPERAAALASITSEELRAHVNSLASDTFEGREAGSRGGHAAGGYLVQMFQKYGLKPAGTNGSYYQPFGAGYRNVLGLAVGSDPKLTSEVILVGAHYDHVGYGTQSNSYGPVGRIHNGADDNASGVATLLEVIDAYRQLDPQPARSVLFALWDGEEKGLLGSLHWLGRPTIPLDRVRVAVNLDMVGRLRNDRLEVTGARSAAGLRNILSQGNASTNILLDYTWKMEANSDHHSFYERGIPILMLHTGLHGDYHRPSDDAEKINVDGMQRVAQLLCNAIAELADRPTLSNFRQAARRELGSGYAQQMAERPLAPLPGRLGLAWDPNDKSAPGLRIVSVVGGSAAARAGLAVGDRLVEFGGIPLSTDVNLGELVLPATSPVKARVQRRGAAEPQDVTIELSGSPVRLGLSWRSDNAEPESLKLVRIVPNSPAQRAGLRLMDRVCEVSGKPVVAGDDLGRIISEAAQPARLVVDRQGRRVEVELPEPPHVESAAPPAGT